MEYLHTKRIMHVLKRNCLGYRSCRKLLVQFGKVVLVVSVDKAELGIEVQQVETCMTMEDVHFDMRYEKEWRNGRGRRGGQKGVNG